MSRRRLMMQMLTQADNNLLYLLEDYKQSWNCVYKIESVWQNNILTLKHTSAGFMGASYAYSIFIGAEQKASTGASLILGNSHLPTLDSSKRYRLTLTVLKVNANTATDTSEGELSIVFGSSQNYKRVNIPLCDITVGTQFILEPPSAGAIDSAIFGSNKPNPIWNFDFDVKFEEV